MTTRILNFKNFIIEYYPEYSIDKDNIEAIRLITLWCARDVSFNNPEIGFHIDKGLLIMGEVGSGKTDLFRLLNIYLEQYLRSKYCFKYAVVWSFTSEFNKSGYDSFNDQQNGNRYYDELCFINKSTHYPEKERASRYGQKLVIGEELILMRYNCFKAFGYQTHFSTNATLGELEEIYGEAAASRLIEMCNIISLTGRDRRRDGKVNIYNNKNKDFKLESRKVSEAEIEENQKVLDEQYKIWVETRNIDASASLHYTMLKVYNCDLGDSDLMDLYKKQAEEKYVPSFLIVKDTESMKQKDKNSYISIEAKKIAVNNFYQKLFDSGAKSIFGTVFVDDNNNKIEPKV